MKIELKSTLYFDFCFVSLSLFDLEIAIEIRQAYKRFRKLPYNTIILAHCAIKFLDLNFLCVSEVFTYLDYIFSPALAWDKIKSKKA